MSQTIRTLASGDGWRAIDVVCAGSQRPFEEQHGDQCVAMVSHGTFSYRSRQGRAVLAPGALLLGNCGACFECGHEHSRGDRCLSFHFTPDHWERLMAGLPVRRTKGFAAPNLPPIRDMAALYADAETAREQGDDLALEEVGLRLAGAAVAQGDRAALPKISRRDQKRVAEAIRLIEDDAERSISLGEMAAATATSPYHFLRVFRDIAGMTPHQFVLKTRLHRAALRLRLTDEQVSTIALDAGFNDLSTFNRRFRKVMGMAPGSYRTRILGAERAATGNPRQRLPRNY